MHLTLLVALTFLSCALSIPSEGYEYSKHNSVYTSLSSKEDTANILRNNSSIGNNSRNSAQERNGRLLETSEIEDGRNISEKSSRNAQEDEEEKENKTLPPNKTSSNVAEHREAEDYYSTESAKFHEVPGDNEGTLKSQIVEIKIGSGGNSSEQQPDEEDLVEAANYGLRAMHELYYVKEPKLYSMGLYLEKDNPAGFVAAFNDQTDEARALARYGFAVLQGTSMFMTKFPNATKELILSRRGQRNPLARQCPNRGTPDCPLGSLRYRTSDGSCNNLENLWWGSAMSTMQRFLPPVYQDGVQSIRRSKTGRPLPSPRDISSIVHEDKDVPLASVTHMSMQWGQFVDHDLTATGQSRGFNGTVPQCCLNAGAGFQPPEFMHPECLPIPVSLKDSFFGPLGVRCLEFVRSGAAPREDCGFGPREQLSQVTSYLDASTVYSSNAFHTDSLRLFRNGLLQYGRIQSRRPVLPRQDSDLCKRGSLSTSCFRAGDGRLSEQPALTSLHVVFLRLHNRVATKLAALNFHWSDEKLFQESRRIVGAIVQHITYREFLPIVLGQDVMKIFDLEPLRKGYYEGYNPKVNPTIANGFSTAAYRFGHSLVQHSFVRFDSHHRPILNNVSIHDEFSNPVNLETAGSVDRLLLGLVNQPSQRRDEHITEELTNHLFQTPRFPFGMDLASLNIQRGRDHGIPPYVQWREPCGLSPIRTFEDLERVMLPGAVRKFRLLYSSVEDIDLFPAGLAENSVAGGLVGPTFACIIAQQFGNLRRGDRFWYENPSSESAFTPGQLQQIRRVTLAQVLCHTVDNVDTIQPFVFLTADSLRNQRVSCDDPSIGQLNLEFWSERPAEFRSGEETIEKSNKRFGNQPKATSPRPSTKERETTRINSGTKQREKIIPIRQKPIKASIHQHNKVIIKRPLGPPDNFTVVVQNHAVNSPLFLNDAIFGSDIKINPSERQTPRPPNGDDNYRPDNQGINQFPQGFPMYPPQVKPIPTEIPTSFQNVRPYVPHGFNDPSNPNPLHHGFHSLPYTQNGVVFDSIPISSPRPSLYTYYTNFLQRQTTKKPPQQMDAYLVNYRPQDYPQPGLQGPLYGQSHLRPSTSWSTLEPNYEANDPLVYKLSSNNPGNSQSDPNRPSHQYSDKWNSQSYQSRPISRPNEQQSDSWNPPSYQNRPIIEDLLEKRPKPLNQNDQSNEFSGSSYQGETRPDIQYDSEISRPFYQTQKRPVQADPDGWSTLPSYHQESKPRPPIYQDSGVHTSSPVYEVVRPSTTNAPSYQTGSTHRPTIIENDHPFTDTSTNYRDPVNPLSYPKPSTSFQNSDAYSSTPSYQKQVEPSSTREPWLDYHRQSGEPVGESNSGITIQTYSSRPIRVPDYSAGVQPTNDYTKRPIVANVNNHSDKLLNNTSSQRTEEYSKPTKVYSVTILSDAGETVGRPSYLDNRSHSKIRSEVPRPLVPQAQSNNTRRPGQFYYEKNVLRRYPESNEDSVKEIGEQRTKGDTEGLSTLLNTRGYGSNETEINNQETRDNEEDYSEMSHVTIGNSEQPIDDDDYDLDGAFSERNESVASNNRTSLWLNPEEDTSLSSVQEMPASLEQGTTTGSEVPSPILSRNHDS